MASASDIKYVANIPPSVREGLLSHAAETLHLAELYLPQAIHEKDSVAVKFYAESIHNHAIVGHPFPDADLIKLAPILFDASVGVSSAHLSIPARIRSAAALEGMLRKAKRKAFEIKNKLAEVFPWRHLYHRLDETLQRGPGAVLVNQCGNSLFKEYKNQLGKLACRVRNFFPAESAKEILDELLSQYAPSTSRFYECQLLLCLLLPTHDEKSVALWFPKLLASLSWADKCSESVACLADLFSRTAKGTVRRFNSPEVLGSLVPWDKALQQFLDAYLHLLKLKLDNKASARPQNQSWPGTCAGFIEFSLSKSLARMVIYCIDISTSNCGAMQMFKNFIQSVKSFVHPSNEGEWTNPLADFIVECPRLYLKRIGDVNRFIQQVVPSQELTDALFPLSLIGLYSKSRKMRNASHASFRYMGRIFPDVVIGKLMDEIIPNLDPSAISHGHRTLSSLECLADISTVLLHRGLYPKGSQFLEKILWQTLPGIDANDLMKTASTFTFYTAFFLHVPIISASMETNPSSEEKEGEEEARRLTFGFKDWASSVTESLLNFILQLDKYEKNNFIDKMTRQSLALFTKAFFGSLSSEIHEICLKKIIKNCETSFNHRARKYFGILCASISFSNPTTSLPVFFDFLKSCIGSNLDNSIEESSMQWILYLLSQAVRHTGISLLPFLPDIEKVLDMAYSQESRGVRSMARKLSRNVLNSLTAVYPLDFKNFPKQFWSEDWKHWQDWGRYADLVENADDFQIDWHNPSDKEIEAARKFSNSEISKSRLNDAIKGDTEFAVRAILRAAAVVEGCSFFLGNFETSQSDESLVSSIPSKLDENLIPLKGPKFSKLSTIVIEVDGVPARQWALNTLISCFNLPEKMEVDDTKVDSKGPEYWIAVCKFAELLLTGADTKLQLQGPTAMISRYLLSNFKEYIGKYKHTMRSLLIERAKNFNYVRFLLASGNSLSCAPAVINFYKKILELTLQDDPNVQEKSKSVVLRYLRIFPALANFTVEFILNTLSSTLSSDNAIKGAISIVNTPEFRTIALQNWGNFAMLASALCRCDVHKDDVIQTSISGLFQEMVNNMYPLPICNDKSFLLYQSLQKQCASIVMAHEEGNLHWRYGLMGSVFLYFLIRPNTPILPQVFQVICKSLVSQLSFSRRISTYTLCMIVNQQIIVWPGESRVLSSDEIQKELSFTRIECDDPSTTIHYEVLKNSLGWNPESNILRSRLPMRLNVSEEISLKFLEDIVMNNFSKLINFISEDHISFDESGNLKRKDGNAGAGASLVSSLPFSSLCSDSILGLESRVFEPVHVELLEYLCTLFPDYLEKLISFICKQDWLHDENLYSTFVSESFVAVVRVLSKVSHTLQTKHSSNLLKFVLEVTDKCSLQTLDDWLTGFRFVTIEMDPRQLEWFYLQLIDEGICSPEFRVSSPSILFRRMKIAQTLLIEFGWRSGLLNSRMISLLDECKDILLCSPFQQVRQEAARVLMLVSRNSFRITEDYSAAPISPKLVVFVNQAILNRLSTIDQESKSDITLLESALSFFNLSLQFNFVRSYEEYFVAALIPLLSATKNVNVECSASAKSCVDMFSFTRFSTQFIDRIIEQFSNGLQILSWTVKAELLKTLALWLFQNNLATSKAQFQKLTSLLIDALREERLEVRETAMQSLAQILACSGSKVNFEKLQKKFFKSAKAKGKANITERASGIYGLCAMVYSEPWDVPVWMPRTLAFVAEFAHDSTPISKTARKLLSEFKRSRQDTWHIVETKFNEEELSAIRSVDTAPSYFA